MPAARAFSASKRGLIRRHSSHGIRTYAGFPQYSIFWYSIGVLITLSYLLDTDNVDFLKSVEQNPPITGSKAITIFMDYHLFMLGPSGKAASPRVASRIRS